MHSSTRFPIFLLGLVLTLSAGAQTQPNSPDYTPLDISVLRGAPESAGPSSRTTPLAITEIMYNPLARPDGRETEFIEIFNSDLTDLNISGFRLTGEVEFTFPTNTVIQARSYLVVAPVPADVQAAYGISGVLGGFTNRLANGGGVLRLRNKSKAVLLEINYSNDDPWPLAADNGGHSIVLARPSYGEDDPQAWRASDVAGGSPGSADPVTANAHATIMINEVLAQSNPPELDFIELYNYSAQPVDISGCTLSDRADTNKFRIPADTTIPAKGFVSFDQNRLGFALSSLGETIYLRNPAGNRIIDVIRFGPQASGVSLGRSPDGATAVSELSAKTPGHPNAKVLQRPVVINEIMFNPISGNDDEEFVELHNNSAAPVDLSGWRFVSGINYTFPTNTVLPASGYIVVARNAAHLQSNHMNLNAQSMNLTAQNLFGNFNGSLANRGERLALAQPHPVVSTNNGVVVSETIYVVVDEVTYNDGGRWSRWADAGGSSLELIDPSSDNRLSANWADSDETAKSSWTLVEHTGVLDNGQGLINEVHIMLLGGGECLVDDVEAFQAGGTNRVLNSTFDTNVTRWVIQGNHVQSGMSAPGAGYNGSAGALHLRATSGGDNGANRVETDIGTMTANATATLRAQARWLRGHPDLLIRVHGNHLEAVGTLAVPKNLGTPGAMNSARVANAGPALQNVKHAPILPAPGEAVTVTAEAIDPGGVGGLTLKYRLDPSTNYTNVTMAYRGAGYYTGLIPGHASNALVGFYIEATDSAVAPGTSTFPANPIVNEAYVRFGDPTPPGTYGIYRLWMKSRNIGTWISRERLSNEPLDGTFVYGNERVIYNAGGRYRGSPWIRPGYTTPTGARCAYVWTVPEDDAFLGADELNLDSLEPSDRDATALRELTSFWMADQLGLPFSHQRYVHVVINGVRNSARGIPIYTDTQQPDSSYIRSWFAENDAGEIFKIDDWFEFTDAVAQEFNVDARLGNYITTGGVKKKARYRWNWEKKFNRTLNDDYSPLFALADAFNAPNPVYIEQMERTIDIDEWLTVFALRHAVGDWDGYGYNRGKNQFAYKPVNDKWQMLLWDLDFSLGCSGGHPPTQGLYDQNDPAVNRIYTNPHFRRLYLMHMHRIAMGPFDTNNATPFIAARYNSFRTNGINTTSPFVNSGAQNIPIPTWINQRRNYILTQVRTMTNAPFAITSNGGSDFSTNGNLITLTGTADITLKTIEVNGIQHPIVWTAPTNWSVRVALNAPVNALNLQGYHYNGSRLDSAQDTITVNYTGALERPEDYLVINEIMYNPTQPGASYVEIHNRSTQSAFNVSNYQLNGADFTFPEGAIIPPGAFWVLAADPRAFTAAYGTNSPVAGMLGGVLENGGETLTLLSPGATLNLDVVIDSVTYDDDAPWPAAADGFGASLQLIDPALDNNRVANWAAATGPNARTPGAANVTGQTPPELPLLWLNELQTGNLSGPTDNAGEREPWLELHNSSGAAIDLGGFYLSDRYSQLTKWPLPAGAAVASGGFKLVWLDNEPAESTTDHLHATFRPSTGLGSLFLTKVSGGATSVVDYLNYEPLNNDRAFGAFPDGNPGGRRLLYFATPGSTNNAQFPGAPIFINEWMAGNSSTMADPADGDFDDWLELYNAGPVAVDLSGYFLTDDMTETNKWAIPAGTSISAAGYLLVWADQEGAQNGAGRLHANFRLGLGGESIGLFDPNGKLVDQVTFGQQTNDVSQGRWPNGNSTLAFMSTPTPGGPNRPVQLQITGITLNLQNVEATWASQAGTRYRVLYKTDLNAPFWQLLVEVTATGPSASFTDSRAVSRAKFYRLETAP